MWISCKPIVFLLGGTQRLSSERSLESYAAHLSIPIPLHSRCNGPIGVRRGRETTLLPSERVFFVGFEAETPLHDADLLVCSLSARRCCQLKRS